MASGCEWKVSASDKIKISWLIMELSYLLSTTTAFWWTSQPVTNTQMISSNARWLSTLSLSLCDSSTNIKPMCVHTCAHITEGLICLYALERLSKYHSNSRKNNAPCSRHIFFWNRLHGVTSLPTEAWMSNKSLHLQSLHDLSHLERLPLLTSCCLCVCVGVSVKHLAPCVKEIKCFQQQSHFSPPFVFYSFVSMNTAVRSPVDGVQMFVWQSGQPIPLQVITIFLQQSLQTLISCFHDRVIVGSVVFINCETIYETSLCASL